MFTALRNCKGDFTFKQSGGDQAATLRRSYGMHRMHVGVAAPEGQDLVRIAPRRPDQPVAMGRVVGNDGDAVGFEALEDLTLGIGDRLFGTEALDMRRCDG